MPGPARRRCRGPPRCPWPRCRGWWAGGRSSPRCPPTWTPGPSPPSTPWTVSWRRCRWRTSRCCNVLMIVKYTIRSIVCEASCHSVILSSCHSVIPSSRHPIILSSCHQSVFNIATNRRTNKQHHELQVCFADKNTKHGDQVNIITRPYIGSVCNSVDLDSNHSHSEQSGEHFFYIWTLGSNSVEIMECFLL